MKTTLPKNPGDNRQWLLIDATDKPLGRLASRIARLLRGKHKAIFTPMVDVGDFVVVINAGKVRLTGRKEILKTYQRFSGFRGGLRKVPAERVRERHPDRMIRQAVKGMLPRNNMSRQIVRRLKVYGGSEHPHAAQKPEKMD